MKKLPTYSEASKKSTISFAKGSVLKSVREIVGKELTKAVKSVGRSPYDKEIEIYKKLKPEDFDRIAEEYGADILSEYRERIEAHIRRSR